MATKPVERGVITSGYGNRVLNGNKEFHTGVDIGVVGNPLDTPVVFAKDGKIAWMDKTREYNKVTRRGSFGMVVYVRMADDYVAIYPHLNSIDESLFIGKEVKEGEQVGIMGNTGFSFGVHLHYEERVGLSPGGSREPKDIIALYVDNTEYPNE